MRTLIIFNTDNHRFGYITNDPSKKNKNRSFVEVPYKNDPKDRSHWDIYEKDTFEQAKVTAESLGFTKVVDPKILARNGNQKVFGGDMYGFVKQRILESARVKTNGKKAD